MIRNLLLGVLLVLAPVVAFASGTQNFTYSATATTPPLSCGDSGNIGLTLNTSQGAGSVQVQGLIGNGAPFSISGATLSATGSLSQALTQAISQAQAVVTVSSGIVSGQLICYATGGVSSGTSTAPSPCATGSTTGCYTEALVQGGAGQVYADSYPDPNDQPLPTPSPIATTAPTGTTVYAYSIFTGASSGVVASFLHNLHVSTTGATAGTVLADALVGHTTTTPCDTGPLTDLSGSIAVPTSAGSSITLYGGGAASSATGASIGARPFAFPPSATPWVLCLFFHLSGTTPGFSVTVNPIWSQSQI